MSAYPARRHRRRTITPAQRYADLPIGLLRREVQQLRANVTGAVVDGVRPQYRGMPRAQAFDRVNLAAAEAELRKRAL